MYFPASNMSPVVYIAPLVDVTVGVDNPVMLEAGQLCSRQVHRGAKVVTKVVTIVEGVKSVNERVWSAMIKVLKRGADAKKKIYTTEAAVTILRRVPNQRTPKLSTTYSIVDIPPFPGFSQELRITTVHALRV